MSISRSTSVSASVSLVLGLCAAGCATKPAADATAQVQPETATRPPGPALTPDAEAQRQSVVIDTVGDTVDRFDQIIRQREQAKRNAADVREARIAAQPPAAEVTAEEATAAAASDPSTIEKLAEALRARKPIDEIPEPKPPIQGNTSPNTAVAATDAPTGQRSTAPQAHLSGEAVASGSLSSGTGIQITSNGEAPNVTRSSAVDPMLALQQKYVSRVAEDPRDLAAQLELQMFRFLKDEPVPTMSDLTALPSEDRELLAALCDALSNFRSVVRADPNPLASEKARPFVEMAERIRTRADLTLSGLTLCSKVTDFGIYDKIEPTSFTAGQPRPFIVYCEVDGFLSQLNAAQEWDTRLSLELRLFDAHGLQVWQTQPEETKESSQRRRRDFFLVKLVQLPANLPGGQYMLKASVRDLQANRIAQQTIQFTVNPKVP